MAIGYAPRGRVELSRPPLWQQGFTLLELMVTVGIAAILLALAMPSFTSVINNNRLTAQANELVVGLQTARSEAIRLNAPVTLCGSSDGATCSGTKSWTRWIILANGEVARDAFVNASTQISSGVASITFRSDGLARDATNGLLASTITVCMPVKKPPQNQRLVNIKFGGQVATESAGVGDGACS